VASGYGAGRPVEARSASCAGKTGRLILATPSPGVAAGLGRSATMATIPNSICVVCQHPATLSDWPPLATWLVVDGCLCDGFYVWKPLWEFRLPLLPDAERRELGTRIREVRAHGTQVWLTTTNGRVRGSLILSAERPSAS
jgi:hypothetical protein